VATVAIVAVKLLSGPEETETSEEITTEDRRPTSPGRSGPYPARGMGFTVSNRQGAQQCASTS
jgi:hypothetical protein